MISVTIDGGVREAQAGERLIDVVNRTGSEVPQVCYHPQLGPIQTCDTCMVEIDGQLFRACATWHHPAPALSPREVKPSGASPLGLLRFGNTRLYPWEQHYDGK